jgi:hypothetical protein
MNTWEEYGKFLYLLKAGKDNLPDNVKRDIHRLTDTVNDIKRKVQILYEYLQKNTRYISVQLGVGGWQPFDATYVATKGYGDCKALSNYMYSILKEAGIKSDYTLIRSGKYSKYMTDDFPSNQFDHVILFVPLQKDTIWLECTDQSLPAGYLSDFTEDRLALSVDESGGKLVHTPKYGIDQNIQTRNIKAKLEEDGTLHLSVLSNYGGLEQDEVQGIINHLSKDKVKEYLNQELDLSTYSINNFDYKEIKDWKPFIDETLDISASNYATITGKRLFIIPNVMTRSHTKLKIDEERKYDISLPDEFEQTDTAEIEIPNGYEPESVPQPVKIETKFGKYASSIRLEGNKIIYYRICEQYSGTFAAKDYADLANYYEAIYKADRNKIVFLKKEN